MGVIGAIILACLFMFALAWPWIAEEMITRDHEKREKDDIFFPTCNCKRCGYSGRISLARNARYNSILKQNLWSCPKCGQTIWQDEIKYVWKQDYENKDEHSAP